LQKNDLLGIANGLARSLWPGGISTEGVRRIPPRAFDHDWLRQPS
jgi:hypothetical protein